MSKKRNRTAEEKAIHEEAVRLRKMTDRQLVEEFHRAAEPEVSLSSSHEAQDEAEAADPNGEYIGNRKAALCAFRR